MLLFWFMLGLVAMEEDWSEPAGVLLELGVAESWDFPFFGFLGGILLLETSNIRIRPIEHFTNVIASVKSTSGGNLIQLVFMTYYQ